VEHARPRSREIFSRKLTRIAYCGVTSQRVQEVEPRREDLERLTSPRHTLGGTYAKLRIPRYRSAGTRPRFQYRVKRHLGDACTVKLIEFLYERNLRTRSDMLEISDTGQESVKAIQPSKSVTARLPVETATPQLWPSSALPASHRAACCRSPGRKLTWLLLEHPVPTRR